MNTYRLRYHVLTPYGSFDRETVVNVLAPDFDGACHSFKCYCEHAQINWNLTRIVCITIIKKAKK